MDLKKQLLSVLLLLILAFGTNPVKANEVIDVQRGYWASQEIEKCINGNYLKLNNKNEFLPEATISRVDFVIALLKVLRSEDVKIMEKSSFKDVNNKTKSSESIVTSQQLRIIYGYPDKTFKAENPTTRSEATSAIANITLKHPVDLSILEQYTDADKVPDWAKTLYAKNIENKLYVNYPDTKALRPAENLTRAEAAVLLAKISENLELVEAKYKNSKRPKDVFIRNEFLNVYTKAPRNLVEIYNVKMLVEAGNVLTAKFDDDFNSKLKAVQPNDIIEFVITNNVSTDEGTLLLPSQTRLSAKVEKIKKTKWRSKNDKALLVVNKVTLPNGNTFAVAGVPLTTLTGKVIDATTKQPKFSQTFVSFFKKSYKEESKRDFFINYSKKISPVVKYKNKVGDEIYILLTGDMIIPYDILN